MIFYKFCLIIIYRIIHRERERKQKERKKKRKRKKNGAIMAKRKKVIYEREQV